MRLPMPMLVCLCSLVVPERCPAAADSAPRQGGDTIATATVVDAIPFDGAGTTIGYTDDYDESCVYPSTEPDVVYRFTPESSLLLTVDLWGSTYDTKVWIWDDQLDLVACNDDYYSESWLSKIVAAPLAGGEVYFIVIDGHPGSSGDYVLHMQAYEPCEIACPGGAALENEPSLYDGYVDELNGGCVSLASLGYAPFQAISTPRFCAVSGWYDAPGPVDWDSDWFTLVIPASGLLEIAVESEMGVIVYETDPGDCEDVVIGDYVHVAGCSAMQLVIDGSPGDLTWVLVRPIDQEPPWYFAGSEFDYVIDSNVEPPVRVESRTWSEVKAIFD